MDEIIQNGAKLPSSARELRAPSWLVVSFILAVICLSLGDTIR
jgi:hypothetical protein